MAKARHSMYLHERAATLAADAALQARFLSTAEGMGLDTSEEGQDMETNEAYASGPRHLVLGLVRWARTRGIYPHEIIVDSEDDEAYFREKLAGDVRDRGVNEGSLPEVVLD